jgi:hypothetical protein
VRKLITWALVTLGLAALVHKLRRRRAATVGIADSAVADPADELRQKLAETREPAAQPPMESSSPDSVEARRTDVHDQGRTAIDEMRSTEQE